MEQANSIEQYLRILDRYGTHYDEIFYRGQSEKYKDMPPSISRDAGYLENEGHIFNELSDIIFLETQRHKTIVYTRTSTWQLRRNLDEVEKLLTPNFLRIHRSFIANTRKIRRTKEVWDRSYEIEFQDSPKRALMSRYYYSKYKKYFDIK